MLCQICNKDKLSREFIPCSMTPECEHPRLICLRCAIKSGNQGNCPYKNCGQPMRSDSDEMNDFKSRIDCLFKEVYPTSDPGPVVDNTGHSQSVNIVMLTGEMTNFLFDNSTTVLNLKYKIRTTMNVEVEKQRLLYNDKELSDAINGKQAKLVDFEVKPNSSIILMVLLYEIPSNLNHVIFDLFWGYPISKRDYLDASCLVFDSMKHEATIDYNKRKYPGQSGPFNQIVSIRHSGDVMDNSNRIGHHTIHVYLQNLPSTVTHLFFTLSAWNSPTINHFPNPSLRFFKATNPNKDLCRTTFTHARHSQAVVMCSVSRVQNGWSIFESGQLSQGNAMRYGPLIKTIQSLIQKGI